MKSRVRGFFTENLSYKFVSFLIALILWVTIIGRRDFVYTKTVDVELRPAIENVVAAQTTDRVRVRASGSRAALKKFMDSPDSRTIVIDISGRGKGILDVDVPSHMIEVPVGVKVLSVRPNVIRAEVTGRPQ